MEPEYKPVYSFYLAGDAHSGYEKTVKFGDLYFSCDSRTAIQTIENGGKGVLVFGDCVNVVTGDSSNVADYLLKGPGGIGDVCQREKELGGKYIVLYYDGNGCYVLGDATGSIPVFFSTESASCSNSKKAISEKCGFLPDETLAAICSSGDVSQALPYDITEYSEIKRLLPNHYLKVGEPKARRFVNAPEKQPAISPRQSAEETLGFIRSIAEYYHGKYKVYVPITGGYDSRVVLGVYYDIDNTIECYTIRSKNHTGLEQDLVIPKELAGLIGFSYKTVGISDADEDLQRYTESLLGKNAVSLKNLNLANTVYTGFGDGCVIGGDIIGQVGKCSLHRDIPESLASPRYFCCKLHNYSKYAPELLAQWLADIKDSGEKINVFDLFSIESRLARWAGQTNLIYNAIGQITLNIFNSRSILYSWTAVDRGLRKTGQIQKELIRLTTPELLQLPFNTDSLSNRLCKSNAAFYYLSSFMKFGIEKRSFNKKH